MTHGTIYQLALLDTAGENYYFTFSSYGALIQQNIISITTLLLQAKTTTTGSGRSPIRKRMWLCCALL